MCVRAKHFVEFTSFTEKFVFYKFIKITHTDERQYSVETHKNWIIRCNLSIDFYRVPSVDTAAVDIAFVVNAFFYSDNFVRFFVPAVQKTRVNRKRKIEELVHK